MKSITTVDDLNKCLDGCIMAFTINHEYSNNLFSFADIPELKYGILCLKYDMYIHDCVLVSKNFLFHSKFTPDFFRLDNEFLKRYTITMRPTTLQEIELLRNNHIHKFISIAIDCDREWNYYIENTKKIFVDV